MKDGFDGKEVEMAFPNYIVKWPNKTYLSVIEGCYDSFLLTYPPETMAFFIKAGFSPDRSCYPLGNTKSLPAILQKISTATEKIDSIEAISRIDMYCFDLVHEMLLLSEEYEKKDEKTEQAISAAVDYIHLHYLEDINFDEVAEIFGSSLTRTEIVADLNLELRGDILKSRI